MPKVLTDIEKGFIQGYTCAVVNYLMGENVERNGVDAKMRELWQANKISLSKLEKAGVEPNDIAMIKKYWKELNK